MIAIIKSSAKEQVPVMFRYGVVISENTEVIKRIDVGGIEFKSNAGELECAEGIALKKGDRLLLIPLNNDQNMLIVCKVVDL